MERKSCQNTTIKEIFVMFKGFLLVLFCSCLAAAEYEWVIKQIPASGLLKKGEKFSCAVTVKHKGKVITGKKLLVRRLNAFGTPVRKENVFTGAPLVYKGTAERSPDWFQLEFTLLDDAGKTVRTLSRRRKIPVRKRAGFMVDKEKFRQSYPEPADFDEFWKKVKAELKQIPFTVTARELPLQTVGKKKFTVRDIKVSCTGNTPVSGYLAFPQDAAPKSLPAIVLFHGAGVHSSSLKGTLRWASMGAVAFDMNAHGVPNGKPADYYENLRKTVYYCKQPDGSARYALRYINDPQKYYFRGMYQRVMRALEFVKNSPSGTVRI